MQNTNWRICADVCSVLSPEDFDRADLTPDAPAAERIAYPGVSEVDELPFSSVSFGNDLATYTTPALLSTMIAVATPTPVGEDGAEQAGAAGVGLNGVLAVGAAAGAAAMML